MMERKKNVSATAAARSGGRRGKWRWWVGVGGGGIVVNKMRKRSGLRNIETESMYRLTERD